MSTNLYSKIAAGEFIVKESSSDIELRKISEQIKDYTKFVYGNMQKDSDAISLSSTFGILEGQPISGKGIQEYSFIVHVNYKKNIVYIDNPILETGSRINIMINNYY